MKRLVSLILFFILLPLFYSSSLADENLEKIGKYKKIIKQINYNLPAVVFVRNELYGQVYTFKPVLNKSALEKLKNDVIGMYSVILPKKFLLSEEFKKILYQYSIISIFNNPKTYIYNTNEKVETYVSMSSFGSGIIINPDGYILTTTNIINPKDEDVKNAIVKDVLRKEFADEITNDFEEFWKVSLSEDEKLAFQVIVAQYLYSSSINLNLKKQIKVRLVNEDRMGYLVKQSDNLSLIKVNEAKLPSSILGNQRIDGDSEIFVLGFGISGMIETKLLLQLMEIYSAKPTVHFAGKFNECQNSLADGSPIFNPQGELISIIKNKLPVNSTEILSFLGNVKNYQDETNLIYKKAIDYYFDGDYNRALTEFENLKKNSPFYNVDMFIKNCYEKL